ncbi:MAG: FkbM family methyltransferase [Luteimonas sp.]
MRAAIDLFGSLKYLLLRPFVGQAWARHAASGLVYRVNLRDVVGRTILRRKGYEPELTAWLLDGLGEGSDGVFVDIGANIGWFSLQLGRSGKVGRVVAIEPDAANHTLLQENIRRNDLGDRIDAIACAAGAGPGLARLHRYKASNLGRHSLVVDHGHGGNWVVVEAMDTLLARLGIGNAPIAAIKIDVEGYEPMVLAGAHQALLRADALLVELSPDLSGQGGLDLPAMLDNIAAAGFVPAIWDQPGPVPGFNDLRKHPDQVTVGFRKQQ